MHPLCIRVCQCVNCNEVHRTGFRSTVYYPGGGSYRGCWYHSQPNRYGQKSNKYSLTYDGHFQYSNRHGSGSMRQLKPDGFTWQRNYVGQWRHDRRSGEGKQYYDDGIYYGWWNDNCRNGLGIYWYKSGAMYLGEWHGDYKHGLGVQFYENGNRYEGHFARGMKNGEGTFYHMNTGQIQKGMWENDICKTSLMQDDFRNQAKCPTEYPIPKSGLYKPDELVHDIFQRHMANAFKPARKCIEHNDLNFINRIKRFAHFEPRAVFETKIPLEEVPFPCTCQKREPFVKLGH